MRRGGLVELVDGDVRQLGLHHRQRWVATRERGRSAAALQSRRVVLVGIGRCNSTRLRVRRKLLLDAVAPRPRGSAC